MSSLSLDDARAFLPAYALGILDSSEHDAMLDALQRFPELHAELETFVKTVHSLGTSDAAPPAPDLRDRFLQRLASDEGSNPATGPSALPPTPILMAKSRWRRLMPVISTVALAATVVLMARTQSTLRADLAAARAAYRKGLGDVAQRDRALEEKEKVLRTLLGGGEALLVVNLGVPNASTPGMQFFWNVKDGRGILHAYRLPQTAQGRAYQLWLIRDGQPMPSRVFTPDVDGTITLVDLELPQSTNGVTAIAVTEEPAGGSKLPTTQPFLVGTVTRSQ